MKMKKTSKPEPNDKDQSVRFIETARALDVDKNKGAFDRALKVIVPPNKTNKSTDT
jgi:hypothetical protein